MRGLTVLLLMAGLGTAPVVQAQSDGTPAGAVMRVQFTDARATETAAGGSSTVTMLISNPTDTTLELVGASTAMAGQTLLQRYGKTESGLLQVVPLSGLQIPARGEVVLAPGALEIQLIGAVTDFTPGFELPLTLKFAGGITRVVRLTIQGDRS